MVRGYLALALGVVASIAFCLSVWTDASLGAVVGAVLLVIPSSILDQVKDLGERGDPVGHAEAGVHVLQMLAHRALGDPELPCDLAVGQPAGQQDNERVCCTDR